MASTISEGNVGGIGSSQDKLNLSESDDRRGTEIERERENTVGLGLT
jgi:hypothetical protein